MALESGGSIVGGCLEEGVAACERVAMMIEIARPAVEVRPCEGDVALALVCLSWDVRQTGDAYC